MAGGAVAGGPVLALVGPTGAGKSELALEAAERLGAELVAVDAFTLYREMDVGTAKPGLRERRRIPHHCLDLLDVEQDADVAWFQATARAAIADIRDRGRTPLLVGGSGLYFRAVVDPLELPPTDPAVRADVGRRHGGDPASAHAALRAVDPRAAALIDPGNLRRTIRALEVHALTGRRFSEYRTTWDAYDSIYPRLRVVGVERSREELTKRIAARTEAMLEGGLIEECRVLRGRSLSVTAQAAIGYAEVMAHLAGRCTLEEAAERIRVRTRRYAVRQQRWFTADPRVHWTPPAGVVDALVSAVRGAGETDHAS